MSKHLPDTPAALSTTIFQKDEKCFPLNGKFHVFGTVKTAWYKEFEAEGDAAEWSVANTKSSNKSIDIAVAFFVGFRGKQK